MDWFIHSAKGTTWKKHKYTQIKNGRYIYDNKQTSKEERNIDTAKEILKDYVPIRDVQDLKIEKTYIKSLDGKQYPYYKATYTNKIDGKTYDVRIPEQKVKNEKSEIRIKKARNSVNKAISNLSNVAKYPKEHLESNGKKALSKLGLLDTYNKAVSTAKKRYKIPKKRKSIKT